MKAVPNDRLAAPSSSRRRFLAFGSAGAVAAALGGAVSSAVSAPMPTENPDLMIHAEQLTTLEAAYAAAVEDLRCARSRLEAILPPIPDDLWIGPQESDLDIGERALDLDGKLLPWNGRIEGPRRIAVASNIKFQMPRYSPRSKIGRLLRSKLKIAEAYEKARADAYERSGFLDSKESHYFARSALENFCHVKIGKTPARTLVGVAIKARALLICASMGTEEHYRGSIILGQDLAEAVVAVSRNAPGGAI